MSEFLAELAPLTDVGLGTILLFVVIMIIRGDLIPKAQHTRELVERDQRIGKLETLLETEQGISAEVAKQNTVLLPGTTLATSIAEALHEIADKRSS